MDQHINVFCERIDLMRKPILIFAILLFAAASAFSQTNTDAEYAGETNLPAELTNSPVSFLTNMRLESNRIFSMLDNFKKAVISKDVDLYLSQFSPLFVKDLVDENGNPTGQVNYDSLAESLRENGLIACKECTVKAWVTVQSLVIAPEGTAELVFTLKTENWNGSALEKRKERVEDFKLLKDGEDGAWRIVWYR